MNESNMDPPAENDRIPSSRVVLLGLAGFLSLLLCILSICGIRRIYYRCRAMRGSGGNERSGVQMLQGRAGTDRRGLMTEMMEMMEIMRREHRASLDHELMAMGDISIGLDKGIVAKLPSFEWSAKQADLKKDLECVVCLEEFTEREIVRELPNCNHCFHSKCIDVWLYSHSSCPLCRCAVASPESPSKCETTSTYASPLSTFAAGDDFVQRSQPASEARVRIDMPSSAPENPELEGNLRINVGTQSRIQISFPEVSRQQASDNSWPTRWMGSRRDIHVQLAPVLPSLIREAAMVFPEDRTNWFIRHIDVP